MRGGKREGAGRPKSEPTKTIRIRVPESRYDELNTIAREAIKKALEATN